MLHRLLPPCQRIHQTCDSLTFLTLYVAARLAGYFGLIMSIHTAPSAFDWPPITKPSCDACSRLCMTQLRGSPLALNFISLHTFHRDDVALGLKSTETGMGQTTKPGCCSSTVELEANAKVLTESIAVGHTNILGLGAPMKPLIGGF